jgi:hypothetical protein
MQAAGAKKTVFFKNIEERRNLAEICAVTLATSSGLRHCSSMPHQHFCSDGAHPPAMA